MEVTTGIATWKNVPTPEVFSETVVLLTSTGTRRRTVIDEWTAQGRCWTTRVIITTSTALSTRSGGPPKLTSSVTLRIALGMTQGTTERTLIMPARVPWWCIIRQVTRIVSSMTMISVSRGTTTAPRTSWFSPLTVARQSRSEQLLIKTPFRAPPNEAQTMQVRGTTVTFIMRQMIRRIRVPTFPWVLCLLMGRTSPRVKVPPPEMHPRMRNISAATMTVTMVTVVVKLLSLFILPTNLAQRIIGKAWQFLLTSTGALKLVKDCTNISRVVVSRAGTTRGMIIPKK